MLKKNNLKAMAFALCATTMAGLYAAPVFAATDNTLEAPGSISGNVVVTGGSYKDDASVSLGLGDDRAVKVEYGADNTGALHTVTTVGGELMLDPDGFSGTGEAFSVGKKLQDLDQANGENADTLKKTGAELDAIKDELYGTGTADAPVGGLKNTVTDTATDLNALEKVVGGETGKAGLVGDVTKLKDNTQHVITNGETTKVDGNLDVSKDMEVKGNFNVGNSLGVSKESGKTTIKQGLEVNNGAVVNGDLEVKGGVIKTDSIQTGNITLVGDDKVLTAPNIKGEKAEISDRLVVGNDVDPEKNVTIENGVVKAPELDAEKADIGGVNIEKGVVSTGKGADKITVGDGKIQVGTQGNNVTIQSGKNGTKVSIGTKDDKVVIKDGNIDATGAITTGGSATVGQDLIVNGTTNLKNTKVDGTLDVTGKATLENDLQVNGNTVMDGTLDVTGKATLEDDADLQANLHVGEDAVIDGSLSVGDSGQFNVAANGNIDSKFGNISDNGTLTADEKGFNVSYVGQGQADELGSGSISIVGQDGSMGIDVLLEASDDVRLEAEDDVTLDAGWNVEVDAANDIKLNTEDDIELNAEDDIELNADAGITLDAYEEITIDAGNEITIDAGDEIKLDAGDEIILDAGDEITLDAGDEITLNADEYIELNANENIKLDASQDIELEASDINLKAYKDVEVNADENIKLNADEDIELNAAEQVEIKGGGSNILTDDSGSKFTNDYAEGDTVINGGTVTVTNDGVKTVIDKDVTIADPVNSGNEIQLSDLGQIDNVDSELAYEMDNRMYADEDTLTPGVAHNAVNAINAEAQIRRREIDRLDTKIESVGAMSAAIANLRTMGYDPAAPSEFSMSVGHYRGETALAAGFFHYPHKDFMVSMSVSYGHDELMGGVGATWKFGHRTPAEIARIERERQAEKAMVAAEKAAEAEEAERVAAQAARHQAMLEEEA